MTRRSRRPTWAAAAGVAAATALLLGGCSDAGEDDPPQRSTHNDADVAFATDMIPHHAQALVMVDMAEGRPGLSAAFSALLADIEGAQQPEIELMSGWLEEWGEPVPDGSGGPGAHGPGHAGHMMGPGDLDRLGGAPARRFEAMWMTMMIGHHEGAIAMAETQVADGEHPGAVELARDIARSQRAEIELMERLVDR